MATVFVGSKQGVAGFERLVAVKCCHPHLSEDEEFVTMFLDEARLAARIHHPNVVPTLDVGYTDVLYLVMDYVEGGTVGALLRRASQTGTFVPMSIAIRVMVDALSGLHAAHELCGADGQPLDLVHRDVSPQNILVGVDGVSRISDFGIAFAVSRSTITSDGKLKGKFSYMAPEQLSGEDATRRIDVFGAGIVLWELLTCCPLFRRRDDIATINAVLKTEVPPPSSIAPGVPADLDAIVLKALNQNPDERFQTAAEFAEALEELPIERASTRAVAAYVDAALGSQLAEQRRLVREASDQVEQGFSGELPSSDVHPKLRRSDHLVALDAGLRSDAFDPDMNDTEVAGPPRASIPSKASVPPGAIEHRRMRGMLAAAMLLLVGSAIGLLLARSNSPAAPSPPARQVTSPNSPSPAHPTHSTKPVRSPPP